MTIEELVIDALGKIKAHDILVYDMRERSPFFDQMILASVTSERQAAAAIAYVKEALDEAGYNVRSVEGKETPWVIIDCFDVIISIFTKEEREHFALEKIYMDVPVKKIEA